MVSPRLPLQAALLFIENDVRKDQHARLADGLSAQIQKKLNAMSETLGGNDASFKMKTLRTKARLIPRTLLSAVPKELIDCGEEDIANQLTLMEFAIYSSIRVRGVFVLVRVADI